MPYLVPNIDASGIHVSGYGDIMEYLIGQYKTIFGDDVYIGEETKDYQLLSIFARCISDMGQLVVDDYNSRNPNYATGNSLDLLLPLVSMSRRSATKSKVTLLLTGDEGTDIPSGSKAVDANGNIWETTETVTLDANGEAHVEAECETAGEIIAPIGTITEIYDIIDGWSGVTNEDAAKPGLNLETDAELRARRRSQVSIQNNGLYDSMYRALTVIEGVTFVGLYINDTSSTDAKGIPSHSICAVVKGGEDEEIAEAIWKSKSPGIGTYGSESQTYTDSTGGVNTINFTRPSNDIVTVNISLNALQEYDETRCTGMIKEAILNDINNLGVGKSWGVTTAFKDIYNAFSDEVCPFILTSITGKTSGMGSASAIEVPCDYDKILAVTESDITVTINS